MFQAVSLLAIVVLQRGEYGHMPAYAIEGELLDRRGQRDRLLDLEVFFFWQSEAVAGICYWRSSR